MQTVSFHIDKLQSMKRYPQELYYLGDLSLLKNKTISIVGSRKPNTYARNLTHQLATTLSQRGITIVSGGALGIDTIAHKAAGANNTIMISGTGLDIQYPAINKTMISDIENEGLVLSQFAPNTPSYPRNFAIRNELTVALGDILIVAYSDLKSGTMRSVEYAIKMGKPIYVFPHRIGESEGTNKLLRENKAQAIYDIDSFCDMLAPLEKKIIKNDDFLAFIKTNPFYDDAVLKYGEKIFEAELLGNIKIQNGKIYPLT